MKINVASSPCQVLYLYVADSVVMGFVQHLILCTLSSSGQLSLPCGDTNMSIAGTLLSGKVPNIVRDKKF